MISTQHIVSTDKLDSKGIQGISEVLLKLATAFAETANRYSESDPYEYYDRYLEIAKSESLRNATFVSPARYQSLKSLLAKKTLPATVRLIHFSGDVKIQSGDHVVVPSDPQDKIVQYKPEQGVWEIARCKPSDTQLDDSPMHFTNAIFWYLELPNSVDSWKSFSPVPSFQETRIPATLSNVPFCYSALQDVYKKSIQIEQIKVSNIEDNIPDRRFAEYRVTASQTQQFLAQIITGQILPFSYMEAGVLQAATFEEAKAIFDFLQAIARREIQQVDSYQKAIFNSPKGLDQIDRQINSPIREAYTQRIETISSKIEQLKLQLADYQIRKKNLRFSEMESRYESAMRIVLDKQKRFIEDLQGISNQILSEEESVGRVRELQREFMRTEEAAAQTVSESRELEQAFIALASEYSEIDHKVAELQVAIANLEIHKEEILAELVALDTPTTAESAGYFQPYLQLRTEKEND